MKFLDFVDAHPALQTALGAVLVGAFCTAVLFLLELFVAPLPLI